MEHTFLACTHNVTDVEWLQTALAPMGQVLKVGETLDDLLGLIDATGASLVFVGVDRDNLVSQCALVESLLAARPLLIVVALGDGFDNQLVIGAMRAGARDFITYGLRGSEVMGLVRRLCDRLPQLPAHRQQGGLSLLYGAQPDSDAALVAAHLGLLLQRNGKRTLLVDLGLPNGESMDVLGLEPAFQFADAIRNLRRLDGNLIETAFARHASGLQVLALGTEEEGLEHYRSAELYLLLSTLRQQFEQVVVNLCGQHDSDVLRTFVSNAERLYWYSDQSVSSCRRNLDMLQLWRERGLKLDHARLLVDRYIDSVAPDIKTLGRTYDMPILGCLPLSPALRLKVKNQSRPLFELAPRDALSRALQQLFKDASSLAGSAEPGFWQRLMGLGK